MKLFSHIDIETASMCNRSCITCLRNSYPDRAMMQPWFQSSYLSMKVIRKILEQLQELEFTGTVCLSHYNEPLLDARLPQIAAVVRSFGFSVYCCTNGDLLNKEIARALDGVLTKIVVSLYQHEPIRTKRAEWVMTLFSKTEPVVNTATEHITTHFSPRLDLARLIEQNCEIRCLEPDLHCIINHRVQYLLCCEDVLGHFKLGHFPELSLSDYWYGERHASIYKALKIDGGRKLFPYCMSCPRG